MTISLLPFILDIYHFECTSNLCRKKADWYLSRNLAAILPVDKAIKLLFVAKGDGHAEGDYMVEDKANICVSCGASKALTLHHIGKRSILVNDIRDIK
jgi:hypothetical protein